MTACGTDYLTQDWVSKSYILVYSFFVYYTPLFTIIYSYYFIVSVSMYFEIMLIISYICVTVIHSLSFYRLLQHMRKQ